MAGESIATAIYKLGLESQQYVAAAKAVIGVNNELARSAEPVVQGEEKIDRALRGGEAALDRKIARFDQAARINAKYAKEYSDLQKIEEAGIGSAEKRAHALAAVTASHQKELEALDRVKKANAENAAALGTQNAALQVAAGAGDKYAHALLEMGAKQADLNKALQIGKIGLAEHARLINLTQEAYRNSTTSIAIQEAQMRKAATVTGLARHEMINLSRQIQDVGVSLAGGQSPFRILIEQGSQIADIFIASKAKIVDVFAGIRTAISSIGVGGVVGIIGTVVAALTAAAGAAALSWQSARKDIEISMLGIGKASGVTIDQIEKIAVSSAKMWGGLSTSEAREFAGALAATGVVGVESIEKMTMAGKDFAVMMGKDSTEAVKTLIKTFETADPSQLPRQMQIFDAATLRTIQSLREQGEVVKANKLITDTLVKAFGGVSEQAGFATKAWSAFSNYFSESWTRLGAVINKVFRTDIVEGSEKAIEQVKKQLEDLQKVRESGGRASARGVGSGLAAQEAALNAELQKQIALREKNKAEAKATQDIIISQADDRIVRNIVDDIAMMEKLKNEAEATARALERAKAAGGGPAQPGARTTATVEQTALAAARAAEAQRSALTGAQKLTAEYNLQVQAIEARTAAERVALAQQQTTIALAGQRVSAEEKATAVTRAGSLVTKERAAAHADAMVSLEGQLAVAEAFTGQEKLAATEEARKTELMRQGFNAAQASTQAAAERAVAQARINDGIKQQIRLMDMANEQSRADIEGRGDAVRVEQAYANAIHAGADARTAAAAAEAQARQNAANRLNQEILATREYQVQLQAINARTHAERLAVAGAQAYYQALAQGKELWQANAAAARAVAVEEAKIAQAHKDAMVSLEGQLSVASARTGAAKITAQYHADINSLMQQGLTTAQATAQAELKRAAAVENVNTSVYEQVHALEQQLELIYAQRDGTQAAVKAAQAYENAIRAGADETAAAALSAATLAVELERAGGAASRISGIGGDIGGPAFAKGGGQGLVPRLAGGISHTALPLDWRGEAFVRRHQMMVEGIAEVERQFQQTLEDERRAQEQLVESTANAAADAARAAADAAAAAEAARRAMIEALDQAAPDLVAFRLLAGQSAQAVNIAIEAGEIKFGTASERFQTQLELYKRAGMSPAQTAADIRAGLIGEAVAPSELLTALDSLTEAVDSNTAAQIGLSEFYTQQGDRLLGYRGFNVQTGIRSPIGANAPGGTGDIGGLIASMGSIATALADVAYEVTHPPIPQPGAPPPPNVQTYNNYYYPPSAPAAAPAPAPSAGITSYQYIGGKLTAGTYQNGVFVPFSSTLRTSSLYGFAEGGIANRPTLGMFGEAGPEAFVPLKGGAIPVRLMGNNDNKPTTVVNINAPLVNFMAEPTRDEVRESAFQASQMLRRVAAGG